MSRALVIVDVQNDFLPGGSLAVPDGDKVVQPLVMEAQRADLVIATRDWHPPTHMSFQEVGGPWPMHCVAGSEGAALHPQIDQFADVIVSKGQDESKEQYSGFTRELMQVLQWARNDQIPDFDTVYVGGLATDYCVAATAFDIVTEWPDLNVVVLKDASRGIWAETTEEELVEHFTERGIVYRNRESD